MTDKHIQYNLEEKVRRLERENEELKEELKQSEGTSDMRYSACDSYFAKTLELEDANKKLQQENNQLKEESRQRGFRIADLQDHENTLNGQIRDLQQLRQRVEHRISVLFDELNENDEEEYAYNEAVIKELQQLLNQKEST